MGCALAWFNFELECQKGCHNTVADVFSWVTPWHIEMHPWWSHIRNGTSGQSPWPGHGGGQPMLGTRSMCHHRPHTCRNAWYWLSWGPERRPNVECSVGLAEGTEADRFEGTSGRTCLQWKRQTDPMDSAELCNSSGGLVPVLNTQRWDWRSPALCGPQGSSCCHFEQVPLRCRSWGTWPYPVLVGALLVARYDQPDAAVYQVLHSLLAAWGQFVQSALHPIVATAPMDLLHIDLTSIEMTMELNRLPKVTNVLVFEDHFTKHIIVYMTPDQTAKTVIKFLYQGYILILGALARLLSDHGANFMSSIIGKMCKLLGMKKLWTTPYHPQMNGSVERSHQTIMQMIGKLGEDKKADWPGHLAEIVHAYNATQSTVM